MAKAKERRVKWTRSLFNVREWSGDTGGWGKLLIQAARPQGRAMRFYLMDAPFVGSPTTLGDYPSLKEAQDAGEALVRRLGKL